jgi:hypothetical protein
MAAKTPLVASCPRSESVVSVRELFARKKEDKVKIRTLTLALVTLALVFAEQAHAQQCCVASPTVIQFMTDDLVPGLTGMSIGPYHKVDGYRYINIYVEFSQKAANEPPVDLGVMFSFDQGGLMGSRRFVTLESNVPVPQTPWLIAVSGADSWHGSPHDKSSYTARIPIMGPFIRAIAYNAATFPRKVSVWGYLTQ